MFYGTLRLWSVLFFVFGILTLIGAVIGIIVTLFNVDSFWQGLVVLVIGTPVALFLATWPIAFSQLIAAVVRTADNVELIRDRV